MLNMLKEMQEQRRADHERLQKLEKWDKKFKEKCNVAEVAATYRELFKSSALGWCQRRLTPPRTVFTSADLQEFSGEPED